MNMKKHGKIFDFFCVDQRGGNGACKDRDAEKENRST